MSDSVTPAYLDKKLDDFGVKLFKYLDKQFGEVHKRIDELEKKFEHLTETLDAFFEAAGRH